MQYDDPIVAAKRAIEGDWIGSPGVTGMDVGLKYVGGERTREVAIRLYVSKKSENVAPEDRFPDMIGDYKTDVIEREFKLLRGGPIDDGAYYDPVLGGIQLYAIPGGPQSSSLTSSGMFVTDNATGQLMILGTFHGAVAPNSPIFQPSPRGGPPGVDTQIGFLIRGGHAMNPIVDADVFSFGAPRGSDFQIEQLGNINGVKTVSASDIGTLPVSKRGRTTGVTNGNLDGIDCTVVVELTPTENATYTNLLGYYSDPDLGVIVPVVLGTFNEKGDSGSVVLDFDGNVVGMVTVGAGGDQAYGAAIPDVLAALNVSPLFTGSTLHRQVILSSEESPQPPGSGNRGEGTDPSSWGGVTTGIIRVGALRTIEWTLTDTYQVLVITATAVCFDQPQFSWSIADYPHDTSLPPASGSISLNDFNENHSGNVALQTRVLRDNPPAFGQTTDVEAVSLDYLAIGSATYAPPGASALLSLAPTEVQGHIQFTVTVTVQDKNGLNAISQSQRFTLDTQVLTYSK